MHNIPYLFPKCSPGKLTEKQNYYKPWPMWPIFPINQVLAIRWYFAGHWKAAGSPSLALSKDVTSCRAEGRKMIRIESRKKGLGKVYMLACNDREGTYGMKPRYSRDCLRGRFLKMQNDPKDCYWAINICILFVLWKMNLWSLWWWDINILPSFEWIFFKRKRMLWC